MESWFRRRKSDEGAGPQSSKQKRGVCIVEDTASNKSGSLKQTNSNPKLDSGHSDNLPILGLTARQRQLLRLSWSDDFQELYQIGNDIYVGIFEKLPKARATFVFCYPIRATTPVVHGTATENERWLLNNADFRRQTLHFVQSLATAVSIASKGTPDATGELSEFLQGVGMSHRKYASRGFKPCFFETCGTVIQNVMEVRIRSMANLSEDEKLIAIDAWKALSAEIASKMTTGFTQVPNDCQK